MYDKLNELWRQRPFKPFKLQLSSGESFLVRRPENFMVLKSTFYLSFPKQDRFEFRDIADITEIRPARPLKSKK